MPGVPVAKCKTTTIALSEGPENGWLRTRSQRSHTPVVALELPLQPAGVSSGVHQLGKADGLHPGVGHNCLSCKPSAAELGPAPFSQSRGKNNQDVPQGLKPQLSHLRVLHWAKLG